MDFLKDFIGQDDSKPVVEAKPWMDQVHFTLVTDQTLDKVIEFCIAATGRCAIDVETTGLRKQVTDGRTKDHIVGICLSPDGVHGFYIPVDHIIGSRADEKNLKWSPLNIPFERVRAAMRKLTSKVVAIFHNAHYDQEMLEFCGGESMGNWDDPKTFDETLILAYLNDSRDRGLGLKKQAKKVLNIEMIELADLFPAGSKSRDFSTLDPSWEPVVWYACSDAIATFKLREHYHPLVITPEGDRGRGQSIVYNIEKMCVGATRWMERCKIAIDRGKVLELVHLGQEEFRDCLKDLYDSACEATGRDIRPGWVGVFFEKFKADDPSYDVKAQIDDARKEASRKRLDALDAKGKYVRIQTPQGGEHPEKYDLLSRPQLGQLMLEVGVPDLRYTEKSKQVLTKDSEISRLTILCGKQYPFLKKISRIAELQKALSTYLINLLTDVAEDGTLSVHYKQHGTDTGRFTTPSPDDKLATGGTDFPLHGAPAAYDKSRPMCMLRLREAFIARPGRALVSIDLSGVELRIATNMAQETNWIKEYFRCSTCDTPFPRPGKGEYPAPPHPMCPECGSDRIGDLHTSTAIAFYGDPSKYSKDDWKKHRQEGKQSNFLLVYGGGAKGLHAVIDSVSDDDCARFHRAFCTSNPNLLEWWTAMRSFGSIHGYVITSFGRHYPVPDINLPITSKGEPNPEKREMNRRDKAKAERNAVNGPIQGGCADLNKLAMGLIYREVKKRGWLDKVFLTITIHDELVFEIAFDILGPAIDLFQELMTRNKTIQKLQGWIVPLTSDCELGYSWATPYNVIDFKYRKVRRDGVVMDDSGEPTGKTWPMDFTDSLGAHYGFWEDGPILPRRISSPPSAPISTPDSVTLTLPSLDSLSARMLSVLVEESPGAFPLHLAFGRDTLETGLFVDRDRLRSAARGKLGWTVD